MQIKVTKTGIYAIHHAWGPFIELEAGQVLSLEPPFTANFFNTMVDDWKCAVRVAPEATEVAGVPADIQSILDLASTKNEAKSLLETWAKETYGIDIDRSKKLEEVVEELTEVVNNAG